MKSNTQTTPKLLGTLLLAAFVVSACDSANLIGPDNQLEVTNAADSFQWQVTSLDQVSQTLRYDWTQTGTTADVNQSAGPSAGSSMLRILDGTGTEVYSRSLAESGTFTTGQGTAGTWVIEVSLFDASGAVNFRVEKP